MAIGTSGSPDISERIPTGFSKRTSFSGAVGAGLVNFAKSADILIGELPFRLAIAPDRPYRRQSVPVSKERYDSSSEAGEQTLSGFWLRSQTSWHRGSGITFYEPADEGTAHRYAGSAGVDVWDEGNLTLLRRMDKVASADSLAAGAVYNGADVAVLVSGTTVSRVSDNGTLTALGSLPAAGTKPTVWGPTAWVGHASGVSRVALSGTVAAAYSVTGTPMGVQWAKGRLIAWRDNKVYELNAAAAAATALPTTPLVEHPLTDWTWTGAADAPGAFLVGGYAQGQGGIYRVALEDEDGKALPTLGAATQVAMLPPGEIVTALESYLGTYLAIGTNKGVRIAVLGEKGALQYGPLIVETTSPVLDFAARDTFVYATVTNGIDGQSGVVRINLSEEVEKNSGRFAWASDAQAHAFGAATSVAFLGVSERVVLTVTGQGAYLQSATAFEPSGYVTSGQVRYGTVENKSFQFLRLQASVTAGSVQLFTVSSSGVEESLFTYTTGNNPSGDLRISRPTGPQESLGSKMVLRSGTAGVGTPTVRAVSLKAVPVPGRRQRMIQLPLWCSHEERDRQGIVVHGVGYPRLAALEALEGSGGVVQLVDNRTSESVSVTIEEIDYQGSQNPAGEDGRFDGVVTVTVRTV